MEASSIHRHQGLVQSGTMARNPPCKAVENGGLVERAGCHRLGGMASPADAVALDGRAGPSGGDHVLNEETADDDDPSLQELKIRTQQNMSGNLYSSF